MSTLSELTRKGTEVDGASALDLQTTHDNFFTYTCAGFLMYVLSMQDGRLQ